MADINPIDLQKALKGAEYPTDRKHLAEVAKENGADNTLVDKLSSAGTDRFDGPNDVQKAIFNE
ncbi:DUF2795 domain-containing protein [Streptomyces sp. NPDC051320]|uniref:DUF2795 domain-containing protein n=1 Tax=Streptomyces sp. NPDC051320 TaxID=3154644 RepID=UPI0034415BE1